MRHGAALALREVMRSHAAAAAVVAPLAAEPTGVPRASAARLVDEVTQIHWWYFRTGERRMLHTFLSHVEPRLPWKHKHTSPDRIAEWLPGGG